MLHTIFTRYSLKASLLSVALICSACSSHKELNEQGAAEVPMKDAVKVDMPQQALFEKAKTLYAAGLYSVAVDQFQNLRDAYSPGPYAEYAAIKVGDARFEMQEFDLAATAYQDFIKQHPSSKAMPYVMLRAGRSFELANRGIGRDAGPLEKAKEQYEKILNQYPDSVYAGAAKQFHKGIVDKLAQYEMQIMEFYMKKEQEKAAEARGKHYSETWLPLVDDKIKNSITAESTAQEISESSAPKIVDVKRNSPST